MLLPCGTLGTMHDDKIILPTRTVVQLATLSRSYTQILGANIFDDDHREHYFEYIVKRDVYIVYKILVFGDSSRLEIVVLVADDFDATCEGVEYHCFGAWRDLDCDMVQGQGQTIIRK